MKSVDAKDEAVRPWVVEPSCVEVESGRAGVCASAGGAGELGEDDEGRHVPHVQARYEQHEQAWG